MKWQNLLRLSSLSSLSALAAGASHQLRASASLLGVSKHGGSSHSWDYNDEGQSWVTGSCPNGATDFSQSPVNISTTVAAAPPDKDLFFFKYPAYETPVKMVNDGRFLYTLFPTDSDDIGGFSFGTSFPNHLTDEYIVYKMIFHSPSEHTFEGKKVPLEVQLFHRRKDAALTNGEPEPEDLAILAVGFKESRDEASPFLRSLIDGGLPDQRGATTMDNRGHPSSLDFAELFKPVFGAQGEKAGFWDYTGSLTQPPCTGGVRWLIRQQPMNAKHKTLELFSKSVRKSSGGVPSNARALQIIGTRPVFPRFAQNAVQMTVYAPDEPAAFKEAMGRVKDHQKTMKKNLDGTGSKKVIKKGGTLEEAVAASRDYKVCMNDMGDVIAKMNVAKVKQTNDCNMEKGSLKTLESITGGPARLEAAAKHAALKKSCADQTTVAGALEAQSNAQREQCVGIKNKIAKKWEENKKKQEEAARKAKAEEEAKATA